MVTNGNNGTIGANGANDNPFETMMIHWSYNGSNGDDGFHFFVTIVLRLWYFGEVLAAIR